ncbi:MAG: FtsX-like permease family protein [Thermodesulfobacteriota bacterium]
MDLIRIILRNVFRHRLRAALTILGVAVAMLAFAMLITLVDAWYSGVNFAAENRLITRNKISLIYSLPLSYENRIRQVRDVAAVSHGIWYGGIYKDKKNFFGQFAIGQLEYLNILAEFVVSDQEKKAFATRRNAAIAGQKLAERFGWKIGEVIPLQGTIFPGNIELVLVGIYHGARKGVDETTLLFRWDYLNELLKKSTPERADRVGWYLLQIRDPDRAADVAREIDALFENSLAETLTETEKSFQMGFVAMTDAIVASIRVISAVVIGIILLVLANTISMTVRERTAEYSVLKTLGFGKRFLFTLIAGESISIAAVGGIIGLIASYPAAAIFHHQLQAFIPIFDVEPTTLALSLGVSLLVGLLAAIPPAVRVTRMPIAEGLGHVG